MFSLPAPGVEFFGQQVHLLLLLRQSNLFEVGWDFVREKASGWAWMVADEA